MKDYPVSEIAWNVFSVIAGVLTGIGICLLFYGLGEMIPEDFSISTLLWTAVIPATLTAPVLAGFTASILSTRRDLIHALITGLTCAMVAFFSLREDAADYDPVFLLILYWIIAGSWIGGYLGLRKKRKRK